MENSIFDRERYRKFINNWWVSLVLGILFIIVGILVFLRPGESYVALSFVFASLVVLSGILEIVGGINTPAHYGRGWMIAAGVIELILGIILFCNPVALLTVLPYVMGFWLILRGFTSIGVAGDLMGYGIKGAGWTLFFAILVVIGGVLVLLNPIFGFGMIVVILGVSLIVAGINLITFAIHLNKLKKYLND